MSEKVWAVIAIVFTVAALAFGVWHAVAFYNYPCEAFKSGFLSISNAPGRCVR